MKVFVINLERFPERRTFMEAGLKAARVDYEIFPAVDGSRGEHDKVSRYDEAACLRRFGAPLFPGEIACFASHYLLWRRCVESKVPITVMEDDVRIMPGFPDVLTLAGDLIARHRFIRLAGLFERPYKVIGQIDAKHQLVRFLRGPAGTQCYSLSPEAAHVLLSGASRWAEPVDLYLDRFWQHGVESKAILPFEAVEIDQTRLRGSIGDRSFHRTGISKLRREWSRVRDDVGRFAFNLMHR